MKGKILVPVSSVVSQPAKRVKTETFSHIEALDVAVDILNLLGTGTVAGSLRRMKETVHDIDILCIRNHILPGAIEHIKSMLPYGCLLWEGDSKISFMWICGDREIQVDLRIVSRESWGPALQYFTGSWEHNVSLRRIAIQRGLRLSEYGLFRGNGSRVDAGTEASVYQSLGLRWLPPKYRNGYIKSGRNSYKDYSSERATSQRS